MCLLKSLPRHLIGCFSIPAWPEQRSYPERVNEGAACKDETAGMSRSTGSWCSSLTSRVREEKAGNREAGGGGEVTWVIPTQQLVQMAAEVGSLVPARMELAQKKIRANMGGKPPTERVFEGGSCEEASEVMVRDSGPP